MNKCIFVLALLFLASLGSAQLSSSTQDGGEVIIPDPVVKEKVGGVTIQKTYLGDLLMPVIEEEQLIDAYDASKVWTELNDNTDVCVEECHGTIKYEGEDVDLGQLQANFYTDKSRTTPSKVVRFSQIIVSHDGGKSWETKGIVTLGDLVRVDAIMEWGEETQVDFTLTANYVGKSSYVSKVSVEAVQYALWLKGNTLPTNNIQMIYRFDEASGSLTDYSGNNYNLNCYNTIGYSKPGVFGTSYNFTGLTTTSTTACNLSSASTPKINIGKSNFNIRFWMKPGTMSRASGQYLLYKSKEIGATDDGYGITLYNNSAGKLSAMRFHVENSIVGFENDLFGYGCIPSDLWSRVLINRNSTTMSIYVNGTLCNATAFTNIGNMTVGGSFTIGGLAKDDSPAFLPQFGYAGQLDDFVFSNISIFDDTTTSLLDDYQQGLSQVNITNPLNNNVTTSTIIALSSDLAVGYGLVNYTIKVNSTIEDVYPSNGLIANYPLEEVTGQTNDISGNEYSAIARNTPTSNNGYIGNGAKFLMATTQGFNTTTIGPTSSLGMSDFSFSAWINPYSCSAAGCNILGSGHEVGATDDTWNWYTYPDGATYGLYLDNQHSTQTAQSGNMACPSSIPLNTWTHIALVRNGTTRTMYINGTSCATNVSYAVRNMTTNAPLGIGVYAKDGAISTGFNGTIDEVRIYNRILTSNDLSNLAGKRLTIYNATNSKYDTSISLPIANNQNVSVTVCGGYGLVNCATQTNFFNITSAVNQDLTNTFVAQNPSDITSINVINNRLNITYFINSSANSGSSVNPNSVQLYINTNSTTDNSIWYLNGTKGTGKKVESYDYNDTSKAWYGWYMDDNEVYPYVANLDPETFDATAHTKTPLTNANHMVKITLYNVSNSSQYNFFEAMVNSTVPAGAMNMYYCNSSYSTGNPATSTACASMGSLAATNGYNHTHDWTTNYSSHQVIPFAINTTTGAFNNVKITPTSQFLLQGSNTGTWYWSNIAAIARADATQTTVNGGVAWSNQASFDSHLHQYAGAESVCYWTSATNQTGWFFNSTTRCDLIDLAGLPPSAVIVSSPTIGNYSNGTKLWVNYTQSLSPNNYNITLYNVSLYNSTYGFIAIVNTSTVQANFQYNTSAYNIGNYYIGVQAVDQLNQSSLWSFSEPYTVYTATSVVNNLTITPARTINGTSVSASATNNYGGFYALDRVFVYFNGTVANSAAAVNGLQSISVATDAYHGNYTVIWRLNDTSGASYNTTAAYAVFDEAPHIYNFSINQTLVYQNGNTPLEVTIVVANATWSLGTYWLKTNGIDEATFGYLGAINGSNSSVWSTGSLLGTYNVQPYINDSQNNMVTYSPIVVIFYTTTTSTTTTSSTTTTTSTSTTTTTLVRVTQESNMRPCFKYIGQNSTFNFLRAIVCPYERAFGGET